MHSRDLGHSFYVPELRVHQDFVPGLDLSIHFTATQVGKYEIVCTQLCGLGHYNMKAYLEVMSPGRLRQLAETAGGIAVAVSPAINLDHYISFEVSTMHDMSAHAAPRSPDQLHSEARLQPRPQSHRQTVLRAGLGRGLRRNVSLLAHAHPSGIRQFRHSRPAPALEEWRPGRRHDARVLSATDDHARHDHGLLCAHHGPVRRIRQFLFAHPGGRGRHAVPPLQHDVVLGHVRRPSWFWLRRSL